MAEVLLNPIALQGSATADFTARRIFYAKTNELSSGVSLSASSRLIKYTGFSIVSDAAVSGRFVKVVKSGSALGAVAKVPLTPSRIIKYVKTSIASKANVALIAHKYKTVKAELIGRASVETYVSDRDIRASMMGYLPPFYQDTKYFRCLIASEANEFTRLNAKLEELLLQFNVGTATYSLDDWEKFTKVKRRGRTLPTRKDEIKKNINGVGTVTPKVLKEIVDSYHEAEMVELPRPGIIEFKFKKRGRLEGVSEIAEDVNEVIPRHLEPVFSYTFMPWKELDMIRRPWSELSNLKFGVISNMKWRDLEGTGIRWKQLEQLTFKQIEASYNLNKIGET